MKDDTEARIEAAMLSVWDSFACQPSSIIVHPSVLWLMRGYVKRGFRTSFMRRARRAKYPWGKR